MKTAPAKLLLLGEHTVLHGSAAFAIPLRKFSACFQEKKDEHVQHFWASSKKLEPERPSPLNFSAWAAFAKTCPNAAAWLDVALWEAEAAQLYLSSNIPVGYGLGSSGAITALTFSRYKRPSLALPELSELRSLLGELEGYFHGKSSGLDPLVSFCDRGIVVSADGKATLSEAESLLPQLSSHGAWFLLDSGRPRAGREAITRFGESCTDKHWRKKALIPLIELTDRLVEIAAQGRQADDALEAFRKLSALQLTYLDYLIPADIYNTWKSLHTEEIAYLKLCGAGGGGFFLGYALQRDAATLQTSDVLWL